MKTYTPGPWHHETRGFRDLTGPTFDIYPPAEMPTGSRMPVAQTVTNEANARLIMAAPDMLEAIEWILATQDGTRSRAEAVEMCRRVKDKALGNPGSAS